MLHIQTSVVNNPEMIEYQQAFLKKFMHGDYKYTVFNHAKDFADLSNYNNPASTYKKDIVQMCNKLNVECIEITDTPWYKGAPSAGTASAMNFMFQNYHTKELGKYFVIDSDMFLIKDMQADKYDEYDAVYRSCVRNEYTYMWNGIYYFNTATMKNLNLIDWRQFKYTETSPQKKSYGYWTDTGGMTHRWVSQEAPKHKTREIKGLISSCWDVNTEVDIAEPIYDYIKNDIRNVNNKFFAELYEDVVFHYRAGGNWENRPKEIHLKAQNQMYQAFDELLKSQ